MDGPFDKKNCLNKGVFVDKSPNFVWIDLEMTGLDPSKDQILEIATLITDKDLNLVAEGPCILIKPEKPLVMNDFVTKLNTDSGLLERLKGATTTLAQAEQQTLEFIKKHATEGKSPLCGNSIWNDKYFLLNHMPNVISYLHYRIIDVSTLKVLVKEWYPNNPHNEFKKNKIHRALDDIKESIEELKHIKKYFFVG